MSNTIAFAEVKAYTFTRVSNLSLPPNTPPPATVADVLAQGGNFNPSAVPSGHTGWTEAQTFHIGMTFAFTPNSQVLLNVPGSGTFDIDQLTSREGSSATRISYDAVTSRSYHPGIVNVLLMDGSVRSVSNNISLDTWRALGTRAGGEVVADY
jgi:hypothetical protein